MRIRLPATTKKNRLRLRSRPKGGGSGSATLLCLTEIYYFGVFPNFFPKWIRIRMCGNECGFGSTALIYSFGLIFISLYLFFNSRIIHFRSGSEAAEPVPVPVSAGCHLTHLRSTGLQHYYYRDSTYIHCYNFKWLTLPGENLPVDWLLPGAAAQLPPICRHPVEIQPQPGGQLNS